MNPSKILLMLLLSGAPLLAQALNTNIFLVADESITPSSSEVVTFGLPLASGEVLSTDEIRVLSGATELRVNVQEGLRWHWLDNSLRSVTIQLQGVDMTAGAVTLTITDEGRDTTQDLSAVAASEGWTNAGPLKANLPFPRIFARHDLDYLASSGLIPPYQPGSVSAGVGKLQSDQFDANFGALDYSRSAGSSWLFDRPTAMLKAYMVTGDVKFLKEGFLAKQFYFSHVRNDGARPAAGGGSGCWAYGSIACADGKYIYTQPAKLALALFGDNSQWDNQLIKNMALQADAGNHQPGTRDPYSTELEPFTERAAGIVGLAEVSAYEITGDATLLARIKERIESLRDMQQTPKPWDQQYGWLPKSGAFTHSWARHEGDPAPPAGTTDDRRFSPWMSENIADFLWQAWHASPDATLASTVGEMLRQLGNAIDLYGFMSSYESGEGVQAKYTRKPDFSGSIMSCPSPDDLAVELMYSGSAYASAEALVRTQKREGGYVDQHNVEVVLPLALAFYFETDPAARTRLQARVEHLVRQWTDNPKKNCASVFSSQVYRLFNWQHRSNSIGTWDWVKTANPPPRQNGAVSSASAAVIAAAPSDVAVTENPVAASTAEEVAPTTNTAIDSNVPASSATVAAAPPQEIVPQSSVAAASAQAPAPAGQTTTARAALNLTVNSPGAPTPPVGPVGKVLFWNATASVVDMAPPLSRHFWAGIPDVNGDGCLDLFAGNHVDTSPSSMFIQGRTASGCSGTFTYVSTEQSDYTQKTPAAPRITSRYMWGNWYGHPQGLWSFFGHDVDGGAAARYVVTAESRVGEIPDYAPKTRGCMGSRMFCVPLDVDGNGTLELATRSRLANAAEMGYIRDIVNGNTLIRPDPAGAVTGDALIVFDVDNDGLPEIINPIAAGYWKYNVATHQLDWQADKFPESFGGENHAVPFDYDSDGDLDLYVGSGAYSSPSENVFKVRLFRNEGDGSFVDVTVAAGFTPNILKNTYYHTTYANTVAADLNLDGYPDLIFAGEGHAVGADKSTVVLMLNNGNGTFTVDRSNDFGKFINSPSDGGKAWINAGDYDNDGRIDLVKTHGVSSPNHASIAVFRNVTNTGGNSWMRVRVRGLGMNTDGLHTSLLFRDPATQQVITSYQIGAFNVGYQNLIPHAGLGKHQRVDLEVRFAHGVRYVHRDLPVNRDVVVFYDGSIIEDYHPGDVIPMESGSTALNVSPLDPIAFDAGLRALAATTFAKESGAMLVQLGSGTFSVRTGPLGKAVQPQYRNEAVFTTRGTLEDPTGFRIAAIYPDGRTQDMVPYIHEIDALDAWLQASSMTYTFDSVTGQIYVRNLSGQLVWHGVPAYYLSPVDLQTSQLITGFDYNGDGLLDVAFQSGSWEQVIFNLGL